MVDRDLNATELNHISVLEISDEDEYSTDYKFANVTASATFGLNSELKKHEKDYEGGTLEESNKINDNLKNNKEY